jgi:MFS family permease
MEAWNELPSLIRTVYHANVGLFGALSTAAGIGAIAMTLVVGQMRRLRRRGIIAYSGLAVASTALLIYGLPFPHEAVPAIALVASLAYGAGISLFSVIWDTVLQEMVPIDKLGRVSSVDMLGGSALMPIGFALAGILADHIGPAWVFIAAGAMNLALNLASLAVRGIRELE